MNEPPASALARIEAGPWTGPLLWLLLAALWLGSIGWRDLEHPDEGRYSEISREMVQTGDWVTPRLNGLKYFEKPALQYWATAISFRLFGESEFSARLWTALCGLFVVALAGFTGRRLWGPDAGFYAGTCAASMAWIWASGHVASLDMSLSFFLFLALCGFLLAQQDTASERETRLWMWVVWAAMAGATLTKGLIGLVIPGATVVLYSLSTWQWGLWKRVHLLSGLALLLILAVPWFALVSAHNPRFAHFFFWHEHFERYLTKVHHRYHPWYYFVPQLPAGMLPWTGFLPLLLWRGWRRCDGRFQPQRLLWVWVAFVFVFFSLSDSKLPGYILPIFPALALLAGRHLAEAPADCLRLHGWGMAALWIAVGTAAALLPTFRPGVLVPISGAWLAAGSFVAAGVAAGSAMLGKARTARRAALALASASLVFLLGVECAYQKGYSPTHSARDLVATALADLPADVPVFSVGVYDQTLPFYLKRRVTLVDYVDEFKLGETAEPSLWIPRVEGFVERWRALPDAVALMPGSRLKGLLGRGLRMRVLYRSKRYIVVRKS